MAKYSKMQRVVMGILATMFVASLVLAVASHIAYAAKPTPPRPLTYCWWEYKGVQCLYQPNCYPPCWNEEIGYKRQCCYLPRYGVTCTGWQFYHHCCC